MPRVHHPGHLGLGGSRDHPRLGKGALRGGLRPGSRRTGGSAIHGRGGRCAGRGRGGDQRAGATPSELVGIILGTTSPFTRFSSSSVTKTAFCTLRMEFLFQSLHSTNVTGVLSSAISALSFIGRGRSIALWLNIWHSTRWITNPRSQSSSTSLPRMWGRARGKHSGIMVHRSNIQIPPPAQ